MKSNKRLYLTKSIAAFRNFVRTRKQKEFVIFFVVLICVCVSWGMGCRGWGLDHFKNHQRFQEHIPVQI